MRPRRPATSGALLGVPLEDRGRALGRDHREDGVLLDEQAVGPGQRQRATAAALADAHRHARAAQAGHRAVEVGDLAGHAVVLRLARAGRRPGVSTRRDEREAEPVGQADGPPGQAEPARAGAGRRRRGGRWRRPRPGGRRPWPGRPGPSGRCRPARSTTSTARRPRRCRSAGRAGGRASTSPQARQVAVVVARRRLAGRPGAGAAASGSSGSPRAASTQASISSGGEHRVDQPVLERGLRRGATPSPTISPVVSATTRGPAKPITAPASTARRSHSEP